MRDLTECSWPNKDAGSNIAIEMTSLWHEKHPAWFLCRISDRTASITSEESVGKSERSKKAKGLIGLSEERRRTSEEGHSPEIKRIPLIFLILVVWQWGGEERWGDKCMRYDEIRAEEGWGGWKRMGWASDGTAGLASPGEHGGIRGGATTTLQRTKGGSKSMSVLIFMCVCVCSLCLPRFL